MSATYIAGKQLTLSDGTVVQPGGDVPEAETWPTLDAYIRLGHVIPLREGSKYDAEVDHRPWEEYQPSGIVMDEGPPKPVQDEVQAKPETKAGASRKR